MSREAFGDPPESQEIPELCPVCGGTEHADGCEFGHLEAQNRRLETYVMQQDMRIGNLQVANAKLAADAARLQRLLDAVHQIAGELARPSGI